MAYPQTGLYSITANSSITCVGSALPDSLDIADLFSAGTVFSSTRMTEGFASAFQPRAPGDDAGTRLLITYTGFPAATQLYVPDMVAGSSAAVPTKGGDLGGPQSGGQYVPGSGTLLLVRVQGADITGAGGLPVAAPTGSSPVTLNSVSPVTLTNGSGMVVYEVVDSNSATLESAQFPAFIGLPKNTPPATAHQNLSYAPVSTLVAASQTAPVPRFTAAVPTTDCTILGDCSAGYFPKLTVQAQGPFTQTVFAGQAITEIPGYITIQNSGGGLMTWSVTPVYVSGASTGWLQLDFTSGEQNGSVRVWAKAQNLTAGTYTANLIVDGGPVAGSVTIPVSLSVQAGPTTPPPTPTPTPQVVVTSVVNAATFQATPLVAGSLATVMGTGLSGKNVSVTFDGTAATLFYNSATQINLVVPTSIAGSKTSSSMVVTVDGVSSTPQVVQLASAWPSVFSNGVLNQDSTLNSPAHPASVGDVLQIYATGIPANATVTGQIGSQSNLVPLYAGPAPGNPGLQQVNLTVPTGTPSGFAGVTVCVTSGGQQVCSQGWALSVK